MNTSLAIYDALLQAKVSPDAARVVVDALFEAHLDARMAMLESRLAQQTV